MRANQYSARVRIGAAHRLVQRRDLVVELLAALVEAAAAAGGDFAHLFDRDGRAAVAFLGEIRGHLEHAERAARIAIAAMRERDQRLVVDERARACRGRARGSSSARRSSLTMSSTPSERST